MQGNFFNADGMQTSESNQATIRIIENGPLRIKLEIKNTIASSNYTQTITLAQGQQRIDFNVQIDWKNNTSIGENYKQVSGYEATDLHKAFYNDRYKLLMLFPLAFKDQQLYVDAPFDVTASKLENTFFSTWDSIKNNVMLSWVDVTDKNENYGMALFTDHTTSYVHGKNFPLGFTLQYSGKGLWGRDYILDGPTSVNYSIIPHTGNWKQAGIYTASQQWHEPLIAKQSGSKKSDAVSLISFAEKGLQLSSYNFENDHGLMRVFNAESNIKLHTISFGFKIRKAVLVQLNGKEIQELKIANTKNKQTVQVNIPPMGFVTIKIYQ